MFEMDYVVFLVVNVVVKVNIKDGLIKVVWVEEELEGINNVGIFIYKNEYGRCLSVVIFIRFVVMVEEVLGFGMEVWIGDVMERMIFVDIELGGWFVFFRIMIFVFNGW